MFEFNHESLLAPNKLNHSTLFVLFLNIKKKNLFSHVSYAVKNSEKIYLNEGI